MYPFDHKEENIMAKVSKRIAEARKLIDKNTAYDVAEAVDLVTTYTTRPTNERTCH